eukprot:1196013-Prorocentrum_minimum.AAC.4
MATRRCNYPAPFQCSGLIGVSCNRSPCLGRHIRHISCGSRHRTASHSTWHPAALSSEGKAASSAGEVVLERPLNKESKRLAGKFLPRERSSLAYQSTCIAASFRSQPPKPDNIGPAVRVPNACAANSEEAHKSLTSFVTNRPSNVHIAAAVAPRVEDEDGDAQNCRTYAAENRGENGLAIAASTWRQTSVVSASAECRCLRSKGRCMM